jgi:hypothetical protein
MIAALTLAACATTPSSEAPGSSDVDTQPAATALPALAQQLMDAVPADASVWQHFLSDSALYVGEDGEVDGKKELLASFGAFPPGLSGSIKVQNWKVTDLGDVAVIVFDALESQSVFEQRIEVHYLTSQTWHRENGRWRMLVTQTNVRAQDPRPMPVDRARLAAFAGNYVLGSWRYTVELRNGGLVAGASAARMAALIPVGDNVFVRQADPLGVLHVFVRLPDGRVDRLIQRRKFADLSWRRVDLEKKKR